MVGVNKMTGLNENLVKSINGQYKGDNVINLEQSLEKLQIEPSFRPRTTAIVHVPSDPPICLTCEQLDTIHFNIQCHSCRELLLNPSTTISQIFAIIRQWVPQTQLCIERFVSEILKRGANVNDKDGLTDMTLLHYACKAGSSGVGDVKCALRTVHLLVSNHADISIRCRWTDMTAIHYSVYFDVSEIVDYLLAISNRKGIDDVCHEFDGGTPLHIAAANLCNDSVKILLNYGANVLLKNNKGKTALDCIPNPNTLFDSDILTKQKAIQVALELKVLLETATLATIPGESINLNPNVSSVLEALELTLGDRVMVNGIKSGFLRFCGTTQFSPGIWAGVELDEPEAKHDGTVQGVTYFKCAPNRGLFAPIHRICKYDESLLNVKNTTYKRYINYPGVDVSHVTPKVETGLSALKCKSFIAEIGDRVSLVDKRQGIVRFVGETKFASGIWYGIELFKPLGKNDGSIHEVRYFTCKPNYGLFAVGSRILSVSKSKGDKLKDDTASECSFSQSPSSSERAKSPLTIKRLKPKSNSTLKVSNSSFSNDESWLTLGVNVLVNSEIGILRYIGPVDFAEGTWLGVELRSNNGKNDGSVQGKRYFTCKPNKGLLVKPKKVSVRGINGAKLLSEN